MSVTIIYNDGTHEVSNYSIEELTAMKEEIKAIFANVMDTTAHGIGWIPRNKDGNFDGFSIV